MTRRCMRSCGRSSASWPISAWYLDRDHLSDRELYRYLITDALREETVLPRPEEAALAHSAPSGVQRGRQRIYLRYTPTMNRAKDGAATPTSPSAERETALRPRSPAAGTDFSGG